MAVALRAVHLNKNKKGRKMNALIKHLPYDMQNCGQTTGDPTSGTPSTEEGLKERVGEKTVWRARLLKACRASRYLPEPSEGAHTYPEARVQHL